MSPARIDAAFDVSMYKEAPWMTLYFRIGVWTSLAMVLLEG